MISLLVLVDVSLGLEYGISDDFNCDVGSMGKYPFSENKPP
ncbi:hypothetical protein AB18_4587 [Escherichia coli 3-267-03_S1_C1]|nr:hypothetical protein AB18_4587 [Escherichia coli 3-267-03_S1_C1]